VELATSGREVVGLEALVRWDPEDRPTQMPADFIEVAEASGEIVPIGRWVLYEAARQVRIWQLAHGLPELRCNVNLSARQFSDPELVSVVAAALRASNLPPRCLTLEITESTLMARTQETIDQVQALRSMGVRMSIDDFGTGYSSLSRLRDVPVEILKVDRSFVSGIPRHRDSVVISRAVVAMAASLDMTVTAEGVETLEQAEFLQAAGCDKLQGFLFGAPMTAAAYERRLRNLHQADAT